MQNLAYPKYVLTNSRHAKRTKQPNDNTAVPLSMQKLQNNHNSVIATVKNSENKHINNLTTHNFKAYKVFRTNGQKEM